MEKYSKAVSEMYSQFKKREAHPMEKYIGRLANFCGEKLEVVGYTVTLDDVWALIVDATKVKDWGWYSPAEGDVIFKRCNAYCYVPINDLID